MKILTGSEQFLVRQVGGYRKFIERECLSRWGKMPNWNAEGQPVYAWVNKSSWAGECGVCSESLIVELGEPFFCPNCMNTRNDGLARPVVWPAHRVLIEAELLKRAAPEMRSWTLNETLEDLAAETIKLSLLVGV